MSPRRRPRSPESTGDDVLPEAELEVLACLHGAGEVRAADVRRRLEPYRPMSHPSVLTLLRRLEAKGLVRRRDAEVGKAHLYSAVPSSESTFRKVAHRMVRRVFGNDAVSLVSALYDARSPSDDEIARLRALVDELEQRGREGEE